MIGKLKQQLQEELNNIYEAGLYKKERVITKPQATEIEVSSIGCDAYFLLGQNNNYNNPSFPVAMYKYKLDNQCGCSSYLS